MSREIKFRAWDKEKKQMSELTTNIFSKSKSLLFNDGMAEIAGEYVLMQFTGLHNKHGKEIYEGDVIVYELYSNDQTGSLPLKAEVSFYAGEYRAHIMKLSDVVHSADGCEVIGNIYENPELLTN